jgi:hypothetical protein
LVAVKLHDYFAGLLGREVSINDDRLRQLDDHVAAIKDCLREDEDLAPISRGFVPHGQPLAGAPPDHRTGASLK